jgi:hypothetical protein
MIQIKWTKNWAHPPQAGEHFLIGNKYYFCCCRIWHWAVVHGAKTDEKL